MRTPTASNDLDRMVSDAEDRAILQGIRPAMARYAEIAEEILSRAPDAPIEELRLLETDLAGTRSQVIDPIDQFVERQQAHEVAAMEAMAATRERSRWALIWFNGAAVAILPVTMATTIRSVHQPALRLVRTARAVGAGDYDAALVGYAAEGQRQHRDELRELGEAVRWMALNLRNREHRLAAQGRVSTILASHLDVERLTGAAMQEVMSFAGCELGILYRAGDEELTPLTAAGLPLASLPRIAMGEGIPGRAAEERRTLIVQEIPEDAPYRVALGFDTLPARTVIAAPMEVGNRLEGVMVLASLRTVPPETVDFVEAAARQFGVSLANALAHQEITVLALELQDQNERLQTLNEEIQTQNEEIAQQSEEIQVQNEELQAQNEELEAQRVALLDADRQKDEFLSIAVHELRGPITGIKGTAQLLRRRAGDLAETDGTAEIESRLLAIDQISDTLVSRINRLLDVTRARVGELMIHPAPMDLAELVRERTDEWRGRTPNREVLLECALEALPGEWDRSSLAQVLDNLIENAVRYSSPPSPVRVSLFVEEAAALLQVADQGIGISEEALPRVFDLYYRADSAKEVAVDGLGLGLYVTKQIVDSHRGEISVTSVTGSGTTFEVRLPVQPG